MSSLVDKIERVHEQLIQEEELKVSSLPAEIQKSIKGWNLLVGRLQRFPEDEKLFRTINTKSIEIADNIQDFIERDFDDEDDDNIGSENNQKPKETSEETPEKNPEETPEKTPKEVKPAPTPKQSNPNKPFGNLVMEKKILTAMQGGDRISISQLEEIIGKEPDYPEQVVHNITLRKVFLASSYRLK